MEKQKMTIAVLTQRTIDQEARLRLLEDRCEAQEYVLAWLLKQQPKDRGDSFLRAQANEFDQPAHREKFREAIALLDDLRALVAECVDSPECVRAP